MAFAPPLLALLAAALLSAEEARVTAPGATASSIRLLREAAAVGADEAFDQLMSEGRKPEGRSAPAALRKLLASFEVLRMDEGEAYSREDGRESLVWWFSEIGVTGAPEEAASRAREALEAAGFVRGEGESAWTLEAGGVRQEAAIEGPHRWTGGRRAACGFRLRWTVSRASEPPDPPLRRVLEELPALRDPRLEASVYGELGALPVAALASGGTWRRYYDWSATFSAKDGKRLRSRLEKLLRALGYEPQDPADASKGWSRPKTGSYAWLEGPDAKGRVSLRFQPES